MAKCYACPRECGVDRDEKRGYCGAGNEILIAKTMVHRFEEPPISGTRGSGAIFFGGCNLGCVYCQNAEISVRAAGKPMTAAELEKIIFDLEEKGVHNIDLITAAHFVPYLVPILEKIKPKLSIPIVYNSGGYEKRETLRLLDGLIDVYLPDYKYRSSELAKKFSFAPDYPEVAEAAIRIRNGRQRNRKARRNRSPPRSARAPRRFDSRNAVARRSFSDGKTKPYAAVHARIQSV